MARQKENSRYYCGKVGAVVECEWKGIRYIRSLPAYINDPKTPAQLTQRNKFKSAHRFVKAMLYTVNIGYAAFATRQTAYNACLSHTLRNVAIGVYPEIVLDYSKALLGEGALEVPQETEINRTDNQVEIIWNNHFGKGNGNISDTTLVALYCVERNEAIQIYDSAQRGDGFLKIKLPTEWQTCTIQCFMGFRSIDHKNISNIVHIGEAKYEIQITDERGNRDDNNSSKETNNNKREVYKTLPNKIIEDNKIATPTNSLIYDVDIGAYKT